MIRLGTRGARDLARALDGVDEGARSHETDQALRVVSALSAARAELDGRHGPQPDFRDALRTRLVAVATVQQPHAQPERARPTTPARHVRRRTVVAAGALASVVGISGVCLAASRSLPGDPFYGAKRTAQALQLRAEGGSATQQGLRRLQLASARLSEVEAVLGAPAALGAGALPGRPSAAGAGSNGILLATLADMNSQTRQGSDLMLTAYRADHVVSPLLTLQGWARSHGDRLAALVPRLAGPVRARAEGSLSLTREVHASATRLLAGTPCVPGCPAPGLPGSAPATSPVSTVAPGSGGRSTTARPAPGGTVAGRPAAPAPGSQGGSGGPGGSAASPAVRAPAPVVPPAIHDPSPDPGLPAVPLPTAVGPRASAPGLPVPKVGGSLPALPGGSVPGATGPAVPVPGVSVPPLSLPAPGRVGRSTVRPHP